MVINLIKTLHHFFYPLLLVFKTSFSHFQSEVLLKVKLNDYKIINFLKVNLKIRVHYSILYI